MSSAPVLNPMSTAPGCLTFHPTFFISKTPHPFLAFPLRPIKPLHISSLSSHCPLPSHLSIQKKLHFTPLVAQTTNWAQPEGEEAEWDDEEHVEGGVVVGREPEGAGFSEEESYPEPQEEAKLFVGNLPFNMDSEKLAKLFDKVGVVEIAEVIYNRETDQSRGFGFVTMSTTEDAEKAVQMFHRFDVGGRLLTVNKAAPRGTRPERSAESEATYKVYVGNLPWQVDDTRLVQLFSDHGEVLDARVVYDRESGRSRGFGFVGMASKAEMDEAVSALDGQSLDGRTLRVNPAEERARRASF